MNEPAPDAIRVDGVDEPGIPADLLAAFIRYEQAILSNDLDALDTAFAPGPQTLRGDPRGLLVGHDAISEFRSLRAPVAPRSIQRVEYRDLGADAAVLVSVSRYDGGGTGLQTQVWQRIAGAWLITAASVIPRAEAFDRSIWRTVGDPLFQGAWEGPLEGLTVAVKDLFAIAGYRIGAGNPAYLESADRESTTAAAVTDLLRGGASLRGIARTDEFAYSIAGANAHYGTPPNGAVPGALPGGSSSGPAAAVATGQADIALATDTAGSIRVPASYQGLWGLRTTHDLVPRQGMLPLAQTFDTIGWLTRDAATLERIARWCLSYDGSASTERELGESGEDLPWHLIVPEEVLENVDPDTAAAFEALLAGLTASASPPSLTRARIGDLDGFFAPFRTVQAAEAWRNNREWLEKHPGAVAGAVADRFTAAAQVTGADEAAARAQLADRRRQLEDLVAGGVLVLPTAPGPAPSRAASGPSVERVRAETLRMTSLAAIAGLPAVSAPLLTVPSVLGDAPVGVSLVARAGTDIALVRLARRIAEAHRPAAADPGETA